MINNFTEIIEDGKTNSFTKELKITTSCFEETQDIFQGDTLGEAIAFASHPKYFNKTKCERIKLAILETIEILQKILTQTFEKEEVNDVNSRIRILNIMKDGIFENPRIIEEYLNTDFTKEWRKALANIANKKRRPILIFKSNTVELVPPKQKPETWIKNKKQNEPICLYHEDDFLTKSVISPMRNKVQFMNLNKKIAEKMISGETNLLDEDNFRLMINKMGEERKLWTHRTEWENIQKDNQHDR